MTLVISLIHAAARLAVATWRANSDASAAQRALLWAWFSSLPPLALWLTILTVKQARFTPLLCLVVWVAGWAWSHAILRGDARRTAGLLAAWFVAGVGLATLCDVGGRTQKDWGAWQAAGAALQILLVGGAIHLAARHSRRFRQGWDANLVRGAVLVAIGAGLLVFAPGRFQTQAWAWETLAFSLALAVCAARLATSPIEPVGIADWFRHWRPALIVAGIPALMSLVSEDIAPAAAMSLALAAAFWALQQRRAAISLGVFSLALAGLVVKTALPLDRPAVRFADWRAPSRATSNQGLFAQHAVARGGLLGVGVGQWTTSRGFPADAPFPQAVENTSSPRYAATPLATTDPVFVAVAETTGVTGFVAVVVACCCVLLWLIAEAQRARDARARAWFATVAALFAASFWATAGWVVGALPIAGFAAPAMSGGMSNAWLWGVLLALSAAWSIGANQEAEPRWRLGEATPFEPVRGLARVGLLVALLPGAVIVGHAAHHGLLNREETLTTPFLGLGSEERARRAILSRWVEPRQGRVALVEERVRADGRDKNESDARIEERLDDLRRWIRNGSFVVRDGRVAIAPRTFVEAERSGLGERLRLHWAAPVAGAKTP